MGWLFDWKNTETWVYEIRNYLEVSVGTGLEKKFDEKNLKTRSLKDSLL